jgi:hypothetical protein
VDRRRGARRPGADDEDVEPFHAAESREPQEAVEGGLRVSRTCVSDSPKPSER